MGYKKPVILRSFLLLFIHYFQKDALLVLLVFNHQSHITKFLLVSRPKDIWYIVCTFHPAQNMPGIYTCMLISGDLIPWWSISDIFRDYLFDLEYFMSNSFLFTKCWQEVCIFLNTYLCVNFNWSNSFTFKCRNMVGLLMWPFDIF